GPALVTRSLDRAISLGYDPQPFRMQLFLARMQRGDWPAAQLLLDQLRSRARLDDPAEALWFTWQEELLAAAADPGRITQDAPWRSFATSLCPSRCIFKP